MNRIALGAVLGALAACQSAPPEPDRATRLDLGRQLDGANKTLLAYECPVRPQQCEAAFRELRERYEAAAWR